MLRGEPAADVTEGGSEGVDGELVGVEWRAAGARRVKQDVWAGTLECSGGIRKISKSELAF